MPAYFVHRFRAVLLVLLVGPLVPLVGAGRRAEAGFQAGDLGSNGGFDSANGFNLIGPTATSFGQGYAIGVRFGVTAPQGITFDSALLGLSYRGGTDALDISLMKDAAGVPGGSPLETIHLADIAATPNLVTISSTLHPILTAGISYWLVAKYAGNDTNIAWLQNTTGQVGHAAYRPDPYNGTGTWRADATDADPSFAIFGTNIVANAGTVDAPSSVVLLGLGCVGFAGLHFVRYRPSPDDPAHD